MFVQNYSLRNLNSFGVDVHAKYYVCISKADQIKELLHLINADNIKYLILGEGSNVLFTKDFDGLIVHNCFKGVETVSEDENHIIMRVYAGEHWDSFVETTVKNGYGGLENLSLIPGSAGAAPVQNIGAYGVEVKDRIVQVEGFTIPDGDFKIIQNEDCRFEYRHSIFKGDWKNLFLISAVVFRLDKQPVYNLEYGDVGRLFKSKPLQTLDSLRETIIEIRSRKLPDIAEHGNAGSFFKNAVIPVPLYNSLKDRWQDIPGYPAGIDSIKVPTAWLIENAGWKGVREGETGTWPDQPLVIVNYGSASGKEIYSFSEKIRRSVYDKFGIELVNEVNIY